MKSALKISGGLRYTAPFALLVATFVQHRYESFWIKFMTDELALCPETLVVAHGTAADAVLRFVENHEASKPTGQFIGATSIYFKNTSAYVRQHSYRSTLSKSPCKYVHAWGAVLDTFCSKL